MSTRPELLIAALRLAERGFAVVPVVGKRPAAAHGYASASTDVDTVRQLFAAEPNVTGVGIAAGAALVIVDVDKLAAGRQLPPLPKTLTVRSGGGGLHLYYARPPNLDLSYRQQAFPPGVEVKLGNGGVLAPPSVHPDTGKRYRWLRRMRPVGTPAWLLQWLTCNARAVPAVVTMPWAEGETRYGLAALERKAQAVAQAANGTRRTTLNGAAFALGQLVPSGHLRPDTITAALMDAAQAAELPVREVQRTIAVAVRDGMARPYFPEAAR